MAEAPEPEKLRRARMTDEEVRTFIRTALTTAPRSGWTHLLRGLRDSGRACEQHRFREHHGEIAAELRAGTIQ